MTFNSINMPFNPKDFCDRISPWVTDVHIDSLGNIIAHRSGSGPKVMIEAHMDEVALMITYIDSNGFLHFKPYGCVDSSILPAREVCIHHQGHILYGIIGKKPVHLLRPSDENSRVTYDDLWIDIGANNKVDAEALVDIGDYAYFDSPVHDLQNDLFAGHALDNRVGVSILLQVAEQMSHVSTNLDLYFVATTQEEIGGRGAIVAAHAIQPDYCLSLDMLHATDYPTMNPMRDGDISLSKGCVLMVGPNIDDRLFQLLKITAVANQIPCQILPLPCQTPTNANWIQISGNGIRTAIVGIPCRYMHTPHEVVAKCDIQSAIGVLNNVLLSANI